MKLPPTLGAQLPSTEGPHYPQDCRRHRFRLCHNKLRYLSRCHHKWAEAQEPKCHTISFHILHIQRARHQHLKTPWICKQPKHCLVWSRLCKQESSSHAAGPQVYLHLSSGFHLRPRGAEIPLTHQSWSCNEQSNPLSDLGMICRALPIGTVKDYLLRLRISNSAMPLVAPCCHTCFSLLQRSMNADRLIHQGNPWLRKWHWLHLDSSHKQKQSHERSEPPQGRSLTNCLVHPLISPLASCIAHVIPCQWWPLCAT